MKSGEIWLVELIDIKGNEQNGLRPALVLADTITNMVVILPLTSNLKALKFPYTLAINSSKKNGLSVNSVILVFQIRAIDKSRLIRKLGFLDKSVLGEIKDIIVALLINNK